MEIPGGDPVCKLLASACPGGYPVVLLTTTVFEEHEIHKMTKIQCKKDHKQANFNPNYQLKILFWAFSRDFMLV